MTGAENCAVIFVDLSLGDHYRADELRLPSRTCSNLVPSYLQSYHITIRVDNIASLQKLCVESQKMVIIIFLVTMTTVNFLFFSCGG